MYLFSFFYQSKTPLTSQSLPPPKLIQAQKATSSHESAFTNRAPLSEINYVDYDNKTIYELEKLIQKSSGDSLAATATADIAQKHKKSKKHSSKKTKKVKEVSLIDSSDQSVFSWSQSDSDRY